MYRTKPSSEDSVEPSAWQSPYEKPSARQIRQAEREAANERRYGVDRICRVCGISEVDHKLGKVIEGYCEYRFKSWGL